MLRVLFAGVRQRFKDRWIERTLRRLRGLMLRVLFAAVRQRLFPKNSPKNAKRDLPL
jgi:hypothetical protein